MNPKFSETLPQTVKLDYSGSWRDGDNGAASITRMNSIGYNMCRRGNCLLLESYLELRWRFTQIHFRIFAG
jgi:hypothetical protein